MSMIMKFVIFAIFSITTLFGINKEKKDFYTDVITNFYAIEPSEILYPEVLSNIKLITIPATKINFPIDAVKNKIIVSLTGSDIKIYDYSNETLLLALDIKGKKVVAIEQDKVIVAAENNQIKIIDVLRGKITHELENSKYSKLPYLAVYDGKVFAASHGDKSIKVWDLYRGRLIYTIKSDKEIKGLLAQNGKLVALSDYEFFNFSTWDIQTHATVKDANDLNITEQKLADKFSHDTQGKVLNLYGDDSDMFVTNSDISTKKWNIHTKELVAELPHAKGGFAFSETDTVVIDENNEVFINDEKYAFKNKENISNLLTDDKKFYIVFSDETFVLDSDVMSANKIKNKLMKEYQKKEEVVLESDMGSRIRFAINKEIVSPSDIEIGDYFKYKVEDIIKNTMTNPVVKKKTKDEMMQKIVVFIKDNFISENTVYLLEFTEFDENTKKNLSLALSEVLKNRFLTKEEYETVRKVINHIPALFFFHNR